MLYLSIPKMPIETHLLMYRMRIQNVSKSTIHLSQFCAPNLILVHIEVQTEDNVKIKLTS